MNVAAFRLDDPARFLSDWSSLYAAAAGGSFFLSPHWIGAWLDGAAARTTLYAVEGRRDGRALLLGAAGLAPGKALRTARLLESGVETLDAVYIEDNDFLVAPEAPQGAREAALAALAEVSGAEEIVLRNAAPALYAAAGRFAAASGWRLRLLREQPVFAIDLEAVRRAGDPLAAAGSALRAKVARARRLYEARGALVLRAAAAADEREAFWETLTRLHEDGWRRRGRAGAFANADFVAFHRRLQARAPEACELLMLETDGAPVGCLYNFLHDGQALNYQGGFHYEADNRLAPGLLMHALAAARYGEMGLAAYSLLAGEADYKRRLAAQTGRLYSLVLEKPAAKVRARNALRSLLRPLRRS